MLVHPDTRVQSVHARSKLFNFLYSFWTMFMAIVVIWDPRFTLFKNGLLTPIENDVFFRLRTHRTCRQDRRFSAWWFLHGLKFLTLGLCIFLIRHFRIFEGDRFCLRNCAFAAIDIVFGLTRNAYSDKVKLMIRKLINTQSYNFVRYKFYRILFWKYYDCIKLAYIDFVLNYVCFTNSTLFDGDRWWFMFDT